MPGCGGGSVAAASDESPRGRQCCACVASCSLFVQGSTGTGIGIDIGIDISTHIRSRIGSHLPPADNRLPCHIHIVIRIVIPIRSSTAAKAKARGAGERGSG